MTSLTEADCFILEAAEQHGITHDMDAGTVSCSQEAFVAFIKVAREQGRDDVRKNTEAAHRLGSWLSAALDDPKACDEFKADILAWMDVGRPSPTHWDPTDIHDVPQDRYMRFTMARDARDAANRPPSAIVAVSAPDSLKTGMLKLSRKEEEDAKAPARAEAAERSKSEPAKISPAVAIAVVEALLK